MTYQEINHMEMSLGHLEMDIDNLDNGLYSHGYGLQLAGNGLSQLGMDSRWTEAARILLWRVHLQVSRTFLVG